MFGKKINRFRPLYKKFLILRKNPQNRQKVLKFKKNKWKIFIKFHEKNFRWHNRYKAQNQNRYVVSRYQNRYHAYKNRYKRTLQDYKTLSFFYGNLKKREIKYQRYLMRKDKKKFLNTEFLKLLEKRLDVVLYRAKFSHSLRNAQQFIIHGKILVNNHVVTHKSFILKAGDLISINPKHFELIETSMRESQFWPIPPKHLLVNYKTMQIIFGNLNQTQTSLFLLCSFHLNLEKILNNFYYQ